MPHDQHPRDQGAPILSVDTGGFLSLSWSAACAIWPESGSIELWAIAGPGSSVMLNEGDGLYVGPSEVPPVESILKRVADFPEPPQIVVGDPHRFVELTGLGAQSGNPLRLAWRAILESGRRCSRRASLVTWMTGPPSR